MIEVPWSQVPISEPVLPGENSAALRRQRGWPVYVPALVATIAGVTTSEAQRLIEQGKVEIDGAVAPQSFVYLKPGAVVRVGTKGEFRLGQP
jgi:hypothetical protein